MLIPFKKTAKLFFIVMLHTSAGFVIAILKLANNIKKYCANV